MKFTMRSLFSLSEEDKREILEAVAPSAPPEDFIMINKEMWQQLSARLDKQEEILQELKGINSRNMQFLDRHSKFIDYSINVMTQTSAGVTYGTPGDNGGMPVQGRKMFDTGV